MTAMNLLEDWCRGMDVDIHRALLVTGIPVDCGYAEIDETIRGIFTPLGPYSVLNKIFMRAENAKAILVEVGPGVNLSSIPREFPGRGGFWRVVCRDPTQDADFLRNLHEFLESEGRTVEDVIHLLHLHPPSRPLRQNLPPENWPEALGVLLGAVVQIVIRMDAELRQREEARAQELAEAEAVAAWTSEAGRKVKKEPGPASLASCTVKLENRNGWRRDLEGEASQPLVRNARPTNTSSRKKPNQSAKQVRIFWKKPSGAAFFEDSDSDESENMETSEWVLSTPKPGVKQAEAALKKSGATYSRKVRRDVPDDTSSETESPGGASESDQDGGQEIPPKRKAMVWGLAKKLAPMRKKKRVSLGPVSYVLMDSGNAKKQPGSPKKSPGWRRDVSGQKAPVEPPTSASPGPSGKPEGSSHTANAKSDRRRNIECVTKWMMWEEHEWEVEEEAPKGEEEAVGHMGDRLDAGVPEEVADEAVKGLEGENPESPLSSP
ncbi:paraneoplastic antigen-like protein 8A [Rhynchocyon petersi]